MKELFQTKMGTVFFLQTAWAFACHLALGGFFVEEHPGIPRHEYQATVWRSTLAQLFRRHPDVTLHEVMQWRFGASTVKPTGLLVLRLPFFLRDLYAHALTDVQKPQATAIGIGSDGHFKTACHKEYPAALSAGLANAIAQQLERTMRARKVQNFPCPAAPVKEWILEAAAACTEIREHGTWLPDFQPQETT